MVILYLAVHRGQPLARSGFGTQAQCANGFAVPIFGLFNDGQFKVMLAYGLARQSLQTQFRFFRRVINFLQNFCCARRQSFLSVSGAFDPSSKRKVLQVWLKRKGGLFPFFGQGQAYDPQGALRLSGSRHGRRQP